MIEIRNLKKSFGDKEVLSGVNLDIEKGITLVIIGRSGCGKSVWHAPTLSGVWRLPAGSSRTVQPIH